MIDTLTKRWHLLEMPTKSLREQVEFLEWALYRGYDEQKVQALADQYSVAFVAKEYKYDYE